MKQKIHKRKNYLMALLFTAIAFTVVLAAFLGYGSTFLPALATPARDISVGDYIEDFGGLKWRIIGKDENGLLVRTDRAFSYMRVSEVRPDYINATTATAGTNLSGRSDYGTNYWQQTYVRNYLNGFFYDRFSGEEQRVIKSAPQKQILWWGDAVVINPDNPNNYVVSHTPVPDAAGTVSFIGYQSAGSMVMQNYDEDIFRYTIEDKVFLPDIKQVYESSQSYNSNPIKNYNGLSYHIVLDDDGNATNSWTRTPEAAVNTGTNLRYVAANGMVSTDRASALKAITPALYIDMGAAFATYRSSDSKSGEQTGYRVYSGVSFPIDVSFEVVGQNGSLKAFAAGNEITSGDTVLERYVEFRAIPDADYRIKEWRVNGAVIAGNKSLTFTLNLAVESFVTVEFEYDAYTVTFNADKASDENGSLQAAVDGSFLANPALVAQGKTVAFTAVPLAGRRVREWRLNGETIQGYTARIFTQIVTADILMEVGFEDKEQLAIPAPPTELIFNDMAQVPDIAANVNYTFSLTAQTQVGEYEAVISINDPDRYEWADGSTSDITLKWSIIKAARTNTITISGWTYGDERNLPNITTVIDKAPVTYGYDTDLEGGFESTVQPVNAGSYYVRAEIAENEGFYAYISPAVNFVIAKADLIVSADNQSKICGEANPELSLSYFGFISGDDEFNSITGEFDVGTDAGTDSGTGMYVITVTLGTAQAINYNLLLSDGTLTVAKALLVKPEALGTISFEYDGRIQEFDGSCLTSFDSAIMLLTGNSQRGAGDYSATVILLNTSDYGWEGGGTATIGWQITRRTLTVRANDKSKTYGAANPAFDVSYEGFAADDEADNSITGSFSYSSAGRMANVGGYAITVSKGTADAVNYEFAFEPGTLRVSALLVAKPEAGGATELVYNGYEQTLALSGIDLLIMIVSGNTGKNAREYTAIVTLINGNYGWINDERESEEDEVRIGWEITPAALTVVARNASRAYNTANPSFGYSVTGFKGGETDGVIEGSFIVSSPAGLESEVGQYSITVRADTAAAANYYFVYVTGILAITRARVTEPVIIKGEFVYDGTQKAPEITESGLYELTYTRETNAGTYFAYAQLNDTKNYEWAGGDIAKKTLEWEIKKAQLTVTADNASRAYNTANPELTWTAAGFADGDTKDVITGSFMVSSAAVLNTAVGQYTITVRIGTAAAANYDFIFVTGTFEITKAQVEKPEVAIGNFTYDGDSKTPEIVENPLYTIADNIQTNAGTYYASVTLGDTKNYEWEGGGTTPLSLKWIIDKAKLTVAVESASRTYNQLNPEFTYWVTGFKGGDSATVITGKFEITTSAQITDDVGLYIISIGQGTASAANYDFTFASAILEITKAQVERPVVTSGNFTYDGELKSPDIEESLLYTITGNMQTNAGTYYAAVTLNDTKNYEWENGRTDHLSLKWIIEKAKLTVTADNVSRTYYTENPPFTSSVTGFNGEDNIAVIAGKFQITSSAQITDDVGFYTISIGQGTATAANYDFIFETGTLEITKARLKKPVIISEAFIYDAKPKSPEISVPSNSLLYIVTDNIQIGAGKYYATVSLADIKNYEWDGGGIIPLSLEWEIKKAQLTVIADNKIRAYGDANPVLTASFEGLKGGDKFVFDLTVDADVLSAAGGAYTIFVTEQDLANYEIVYQYGALTVEKTDLTINIRREKGYDGTVWSLSDWTLQGVVRGLKNNEILSGTLVTKGSAAGQYIYFEGDFEWDSLEIQNAQGAGTLANYNIMYDLFVNIEEGIINYAGYDYSGEYDASLHSISVIVDMADTDEFIIGYSIEYSVDPQAYTYGQPPQFKNAGNYTVYYSIICVTSTSYKDMFGSNAVIISKAVLTVTAVNQTKKYDRDNPDFAYTITGFKGQGDVADTQQSCVAGSFLFTSATGSDCTVGRHVISGETGTATAANYDFVFVDGILTVTKAQVINPAVTSDDFTYDGFEKCPTLSPVGLYSVTGDTQTRAGTYYAYVALNDTKNYEWTDGGILPLALEWKILKALLVKPEALGTISFEYDGRIQEFDGSCLTSFDSAIMLLTGNSQRGAGDYSATVILLNTSDYGWEGGGTATIGWQITRRTLTVRANDKSKTYGAANPAFDVSYEGFAADDEADNSITGSFSYSSAGRMANVGGYAITVSKGTADAVNYEFAFEPGTLRVSALLVAKPEAGGATELVYNGYEQTLALSGIDLLIMIVSGNTGKNAREYTAIVTLINGNYGWINDERESEEDEVRIGWEITPAALTVVARNASRAYNTANPSFGYSVTGFKGGETDGVIEGSFIVSSPAGLESEVGQYSITVRADTAAAANYYFVYVTGILAITRARVTEPVIIKGEFVYDGTQKAPEITESGLYELTYTRETNAGTYFAYAQLNDTKNYEWAGGDIAKKTLEWEIKKAQLTVTADNASRAYNTANPELTWTAAGFADGDTKDVITGSFMVSSAAVLNTAVGQYTITVRIGTAAAANYDFIFVTGTFEITKAQVEKPEVAIGNFTYDGDSKTPEIVENPLYTIADNIQTNAGTYYASVTLGDTKNYEWEGGGTTPLSLKWIIDKAKLTVAVESASRTYNQLNPEFTYWVTGFKGGDSATVITGKFEITTSAQITDDVGLYIISIGQGTASAANYDFTFASAILEITKAQVERPVVTSGNFTYDGELKSPDIEESLLYTITGNMQTNAGTYYAAVTLNDTKNYEWENGRTDHLSLKWIIEKAKRDNAITISGWTYGGISNAPSAGIIKEAAQVTYYYDNSEAGGFISTDTPFNAGSYYVRAVIDASANYFGFTTTAVEFIIEKAILTVTANDRTRTYGTANPTFNWEVDVTFDGFIEGDNPGNSITGSFYLFTAAALNSCVRAEGYAIVLQRSTAASANYTFELLNGTMVIIPAANIQKPVLSAYSYVYNAYQRKPELKNFYESKMEIAGDSVAVAKDAGTYKIIISLTDKLNTAWEDGSTDDIELTWQITPAVLTVTAHGTRRVYNTDNPALAFSVSGFLGADTMVVIEGKFDIYVDAYNLSQVGTYTIFIDQGTAYADNYTFVFANGMLTITRATVANPSITSSDFIYDGSKKTAVIEPGELYWIRGDSASESGTYRAIVDLIDKVNYQWKDGGIDALEFEWNILKANRANSVSISGWVENQTPVMPRVGTVQEGAQVTYYYDVSSGGDFISEIMPRDPGVYYVLAVIAESGNYHARTTPAVQFRIAAVYTLTYNGLSGASNNNPADYNIWSYTITLSAPVRAGYVFKGWYDNAQTEGEPVTVILSGSTGDITLWAKWETITYTIMFSVGGGADSPERLIVDAFGKITKPKDPVRDGYTFIGWYNGDTLWNFERDTVTENLVLTARWQKVENRNPWLWLLLIPAAAIAAFGIYLLCFFLKKRRVQSTGKEG